MSSLIKNITARQILDSRGNPALEATVELFSGATGTASVPSGASKGIFEALELRDNEKAYNGKGVKKAIENIHKKIAPALINCNALNQNTIDSIMIKLDGTENKSRLGANAILAVSLACAKAGANHCKTPLYRYLGGINAHVMPVPMMNILNGGAHANNGIEIQEFMIAPVGADSFSNALQTGAEIFQALKRILHNRGLSTAVGDEGGFAPVLGGNLKALDLIVEAINFAGYSTENVKICLDVAASEFYKNGKYIFENQELSYSEFAEILYSIYAGYPVISIEDGMAQDDTEGWELLTSMLGSKCRLVGDDLFVTNVERIKSGIENDLANSVLIKPNQIGTLSETLNAINYAKNNGYTTIISHRSGETEDTFIADLAVGVNSGMIKTGSLSRGERIAKYNRLLKIEDELGTNAVYRGIKGFNNK